jgi:uncharacterized protein (TIGR02453 family)
MANRYFTPNSLTFLRKLAKNNNRDWFEQNRAGYEAAVRTPALQFITDISDDLAALSPHFLAQAKKVGGSLMRAYRDMRFSKDQRPYKTNIGIQFRHEQGKDVHAPGFYIHIEPKECFIGVGIWRPDATALGKIRDVIAGQPEKWRSAIGGKTFKRYYTLGGEVLIRPPRGFSTEHPLIEELKRKDFIAITPVEDKQVTEKYFSKLVLDRFSAADDFMQFLCSALELRY